ncbi:uncharacterized protein N7483_001619 [Penicillium malachiteum]|uniref:uncharacterized protein n=1 Tax=Penicillium malachiteum TaxID=1324776 RepID=UPI00254841CC|nr:uncharacterized protein N7483_001619 [Penicillium malachiteum]KAJ5736494.1 hypothetical protein N7483_001619 [Penicillium malachiteum]
MTTEQQKINTQHCAFCNHLLLATTLDLNKLPRRGGESKDNAIILPLEHQSHEEPEEESSKSQLSAKHLSLLLSTTIPDRRATLVRREDGIEKRILLRCGRCRVIMGYFLDDVHYPTSTTSASHVTDHEDEDEFSRPGKNARAVYILPGAVSRTEDMEGGKSGREWIGWDREER